MAEPIRLVTKNQQPITDILADYMDAPPDTILIVSEFRDANGEKRWDCCVSRVDDRLRVAGMLLHLANKLASGEDETCPHHN